MFYWELSTIVLMDVVIKMVKYTFLAIFALYCLVFGFVVAGESWLEAESEKPLDPLMSIHSIRGVSKESIILTPNKEQSYRITNFI